MQHDGKCVICGIQHDEPKKEKVEPTVPNDSGWHRKSVSGILEKISQKTAIYPNSQFPPTYKYQGHHCIALSSLVEDANTTAPKDRRLRLNHFLKKIGFYPNRDKNCIGLPARSSYGSFGPFWESIDEDKPLQMHGPGHDEQYFIEVDNMLTLLRGASHFLPLYSVKHIRETSHPLK